MENINLKTMCYRTGQSFSEVHAAYLQALQEAKSLGLENDEQKVMSILEAILEIDEHNDSVSKKITNKFLASGKDFNSFLEELTSGSIPQGVRPEPDIELPFGAKVKEDEEDDDEEIDDGSYGDSYHGSEKNDAGIVNGKDVDHF